MIVAHPVLEILRDDEFTLWPVAGSGPFDLLPLRGGLEPAEVGTAVMCIPDYTDFADDSYYPWPRPTEPVGAFLHGHRRDRAARLLRCLEEWRGWYEIADGGSAFSATIRPPSACAPVTWSG